MYYKRMIMILMMSLISANLVGCNIGNEEDLPKKSNDKEITKDSSVIVDNFIKLVGMNDKDVVDLMGEGTLVSSDNTIISRDYNVTLDGVELTAIVSYNNNGIVQGVYTYLPDYDAKKWETLLSNELGTPTKVENNGVNNEDGNETLNVLWLEEGKLVSLFGSNGTLSIQVE